jgi:hypothetical protein
VRIVARSARRAEHADGGTDAGQAVESEGELGGDVTNPVGIRGTLRGGLVTKPEEQLLVECR